MSLSLCVIAMLMSDLSCSYHCVSDRHARLTVSDLPCSCHCVSYLPCFYYCLTDRHARLTVSDLPCSYRSVSDLPCLYHCVSDRHALLTVCLICHVSITVCQIATCRSASSLHVPVWLQCRRLHGRLHAGAGHGES